jgi:hypothetical protein
VALCFFIKIGRKVNKNNKTTAIILSLLTFFLFSCQNEGRWYPSADVEISSHSEYTTTAGKALAVTLTVYNTSSTSIMSGVITVKAVTDKHEYLQTVGSTIKIIPGGKIAVNVAIVYLENDEQVLDDSISVYAAYFD